MIHMCFWTNLCEFIRVWHLLSYLLDFEWTVPVSTFPQKWPKVADGQKTVFFQHTQSLNDYWKVIYHATSPRKVSMYSPESSPWNSKGTLFLWPLTLLCNHGNLQRKHCQNEVKWVPAHSLNMSMMWGNHGNCCQGNMLGMGSLSGPIWLDLAVWYQCKINVTLWQNPYMINVLKTGFLRLLGCFCCLATTACCPHLSAGLNVYPRELG